MKKILIPICSIIVLFEIVAIVVYFVTFNGGLSTTNQDWDTFIQIFNGLIITILTVVNIFVFYHLTVVIEDKNQERAVKEKVFEAQSVITQMRVKQYEEVKGLIYDVIAFIAKKNKDEGGIDLLHRKLVEIDNSFLFKNYKLEDSSILKNPSLKIIKTLTKLQSENKEIDKEAFISSLTAYIKLMEIYIIGQMVTTDKDVAKYVQKNTKNIDCSISCAVQIFDRTVEKLNNLDSTMKGA